eukprot:TRINITY_DN8142_c0_g2_i1.p1 TRINITY_DN8142_c0_g2~~TRINITY_DN8142_c0_g2_i1.p1  ORF type:complete len:295 (+),score=50.04 TRINITY_DN8142_c0_g2_i1:688-1572(+)
MQPSLPANMVQRTRRIDLPVNEVHKVPPPKQTRAEAADPSEKVISQGSVGHPMTCAPACKYVKRKGGCREGVDCPNCHECFWSRDGKKGDVAFEGDPAEETQQKVSGVVKVPPLSLGTIGHPYNCEKPCKYVRRKGGCMHGLKCVQCHQCLWRRDTEGGTKIKDVSCDVEGFGALDREGTDRSTLLFDDLMVGGPEVMSMPVLSTQPEVLTTPSGTPSLEPEVLVMPEVASCLDPRSREPLKFMQFSVGSIGHPLTCSPPCKYAMKAKGCKDGNLCTHCHQCRWIRNGPKTISL